MGTIVDQISRAFRDFETDGMASSGLHEVDKADVRAIGPLIEAVVANASLGSLVSVVYATRAALNADLVHAANSVALVYADTTDANNDLYVKAGASGAGSWTLTGALHSVLGSSTVRKAMLAVPFDTLAQLNAVVGSQNGDRATVSTADAGTHLAVAGEIALGGAAATVGAAIPNGGIYTCNGSAWLRTGDQVDQRTATIATAAAASATAAAASASAAQGYAAVIGGAPSVPPMRESAIFGQESAARLTTQALLTPPSGALACPRAGTDWWLALWFKTGAQLKSSQQEILLSKGAGTAVGGNDRAVWLIERAVASGAMTLAWALKQGAVQWMANATPSPLAAQKLEPASEYCLIMAQIGSKPYLALTPVNLPGTQFTDATVRQFTGDVNHGYGSFYFGAQATGTYTAARASNVITVTRSSGGHGLTVGASVYYADGSGNGPLVATVTATTTLTFSFANAGADGALTSPGYAIPNTIGNLFNVIGAGETAVGGDQYGWGGGVADLMFRTGTAGVAGSLAAMVSGGGIDPTVLANIAQRRLAYASLPGTDAYSHNLGDLTVAATGANSTTAPTATGTIMAGERLDQPEYLRLVPRGHEWPHATALGKRAGPIRLRGSTNIPTAGLYATVYTDKSASTVVVARHALQNFVIDATGVWSAVTKDVPIGCGYFVKVENYTNANLFIVGGPHDVGPVYGVISQSTMNVLFGTTTGTTLSPVASSVGQYSVLDISGDLTDSPTVNYSNQAAFCRTTVKRVRYAGQVGNGIMGAANKLLGLLNAALGVKVPLGFANLCTSGHPADIYINDRKVLRNGIGSLTAGGTATGTWSPRPALNFTAGWPVYTLAGSAQLYVNGILAATSDTSGNWVGQGISGTFNKDTGAYSITSTYAGTAEIAASMLYNTGAAGTTRKTLDATLTCFGDETVAAGTNQPTGHVLDRLRTLAALGGVTAFVFSWENYRVSYVSSLSAPDAATYTAWIMAALRARIAGVLGADAPWIVMGDPRSTSFTDPAEFVARQASRTWAKAQTDGKTFYIPAALAATMDANTSPHSGPNADGGQYIGEVLGHGVASVEALAGAMADEIMPISVVRVDSATVDIYVSPSIAAPSAVLVTGAGGEPEGVYFGSTATALTRIDAAAAGDESHGEYLGGYTMSFPAGTTNVVRVHKDSGTIGAGYWNLNWGAPANKGTYSLTTLTAQAAVLDNTLYLNSGGYSAATRPGIGVQPNPTSIYCA